MILGLDDSLQSATTLTIGSVGIAWIIRQIWRRLVRDHTEVAKDRAEINILDILQNQISTLSAENQRLRNTESELERRLGRLETKEKDAADNLELIKKLQKKLDDKDIKIENMIKDHSAEMTKMGMILNSKENQIKELYERIIELEKRLMDDECKLSDNAERIAKITSN